MRKICVVYSVLKGLVLFSFTQTNLVAFASTCLLLDTDRVNTFFVFRFCIYFRLSKDDRLANCIRVCGLCRSPIVHLSSPKGMVWLDLKFYNNFVCICLCDVIANQNPVGDCGSFVCLCVFQTLFARTLVKNTP